jgi:hypothetical protein
MHNNESAPSTAHLATLVCLVCLIMGVSRSKVVETGGEAGGTENGAGNNLSESISLRDKLSASDHATHVGEHAANRRLADGMKLTLAGIARSMKL